MSTTEAVGTDAAGRVADDLAIRNLVARLAHLADMAAPEELDEYVALFTEDAAWELPGNERRGHDDILEGARQRRGAGTQGPGTNTRHVITTQTVHFDGADTAVSDAYFLFVADTTTTPVIRSMGHYHDLLRRDGGVWRLARRQITPG